MKFRLKDAFVVLLTASTLFSGTAFGRAPVTTLSGDQNPVDGAMVMMQPVTVGKGNIIGGFLGKTLNIPKQIKIDDAGFLVFGLSADALQVTPSDAKGYHKITVLPYLTGSQEMKDSLKLRRTARQIRFQALKDAINKAEALSAEQKKSVLNFLSQSVGSPCVVMAKSPLPAFMPSPGPCMIPLGAEMVENKTGKRLGIETSMICVLDIESEGKKIFSVDDALKNDTLDLVVAHENAHAIMFDMYGKLFQKIQRTSSNGHDAPIITDVGLAYVEGWAEAFEAVYGPANPKLAEKDRSKYNISEFLYARQDPIRRDRYVWASNTGKKTGAIKNGLQLMSTEGVIAGHFYDILTSRAINAPFEKCMQTMLTSPMNFMEFVQNFVKLFPEDKKVVYRILLENSHYVTMHENAAESYKNFYGFKVAYTQKKISKADFDSAKTQYKAYTEGLFAEAMKTDNIFANVGPQLWFAGKINLSQLKKDAGEVKKYFAAAFGKKDQYYEFRLDLNTATADMFRMIGFAETDAAKLVKTRDEKGFFKGNPVTLIKGIVGEERFAKYNAVLNLTQYDHTKSDVVAQYKEQSLALWPEDIARLSR
ncbi:MAG: hypothetical protein PHD82_08630 [Candidatus Riflebacteria bacterium]|nr:hypothetical protein [Candidatus Riflebacteria bacterium]